MLSLILAGLLQTAPAAGAAPQDNGLPKEDYELVAWCHGALAGQLELDPIAKADMEKIEGKAKVDARAKQDAEMEQERRAYLKDYERALAAAEAASPNSIHQKGVQAELQGYRLWAATRNKEPIWRMLDWGMWDPNDVGCGDAAKRLLNKATLFGEALKGADDGKPAPVAAPLAAEDAPAAKSADAAPVDPSAPPPAEAATPAVEAKTETVKAAQAKKPVRVAAKKKSSVDSSAEDIRAAIAAGKAATTAPATSADPKPADPGLRGPQ
jgi:hypothetical protein